MYIYNIQIFTSFVNFYYQFISCFSHIISLLNNILRINNKAIISLIKSNLILYFLIKSAAETFYSLINAFIKALILEHFD